jgi:hypothetical protein
VSAMQGPMRGEPANRHGLRWQAMAGVERSRRFAIRISGEDPDAHEVPLTELIRVASTVHALLRDVALVLSHRETGTPGRAPRFVEEITEPRVIAEPRPGSLALELELPPPPSRLDEAIEDFDAGPDLGERALDALLSGLESLDAEQEVLPTGFDRSVLKDLTRLRPAFGKGIERVTLTRDGPQREVAVISKTKVEHSDQLIRRPVRGPASIEGKLEMVDRTRLACRIDRAGRPDVPCTFPEELRQDVTEAIGKFVRVTGEGSFGAGGDRPERVDAEELVVLHEQLPFDPEAFTRRRTVDELAESRGIDSADPLLELGPLEWLDDEEAEAFREAARPGAGT